MRAPLVNHPILRDSGYVVTSVARVGGEVRARFRCRPVALSFDELRPLPGREEERLDRDWRLDADAALDDLIQRVAIDYGSWMVLRPHTEILRRVIYHMRTVAALVPAWATSLPEPSVERVSAAFSRLVGFEEVVRTDAGRGAYPDGVAGGWPV